MIVLPPSPHWTSEALRLAGASPHVNHRHLAYRDLVRDVQQALQVAAGDGYTPYVIGGSGTATIEAMATFWVVQGPVRDKTTTGRLNPLAGRPRSPHARSLDELVRGRPFGLRTASLDPCVGKDVRARPSRRGVRARQEPPGDAVPDLLPTTTDFGARRPAVRATLPRASSVTVRAARVRGGGATLGPGPPLDVAGHPDTWSPPLAIWA